MQENRETIEHFNENEREKAENVQSRNKTMLRSIEKSSLK